MDDIVSEEMYAPSLSRKTLQSLLTVEEEEVFTAMFSSLIKSSKPINQNEVVKMIEKEPKLSDLSSRLSNRQIADRVRTMRKAFIRKVERQSKQKKRK